VTVIRNITLEKELDKMKEEFLHSITHDLRNPMTSIRGFLKFLLDGVAGEITEQQRNMLEVMNRASLRLLGLINDILDIAKMESKGVTMTVAPCDLKVIVQHTLETAQGQALKKSIHLATDAPEHLAPINGDPELLERVFTNLIGNALKFTPDNGVVSVSITDEPGQLHIAITDTGEGIPPEHIEDIFNKFHQVAGQRKGGTGLGLTISKHIVEAHGGRIWAESKLGFGAAFHFVIPKNLTIHQLINREVNETPSA
jgi:signal transduction histidine kinase